MTKKLSDVLRLNLAPKATSVSYAIMIDGEIVAADALGHDGTKEKNPVTLNHTYNVCSISKIFCTVAVMKLVEQGKVNLDTPICEYLPQFTMLDPRYRQITVRHCLNHASGLPGTQWKHFSSGGLQLPLQVPPEGQPRRVFHLLQRRLYPGRDAGRQGVGDELWRIL